MCHSFREVGYFTMTTITERAIATFALNDEEWALLASYMPTKAHNTGSDTDWRAVVNALMIKWYFPLCAWRKIPNASRVRMAWHRSVDYGTWSAIERALPSLNLSRAGMLKRICFAAGRAKGARR